jgi:DNA polymerase elongation subunit (family B)
MGFRELHDISIDGRVIIDMMIIMKNDYKLSSYTLNSVSQKLFNLFCVDLSLFYIDFLENKKKMFIGRISVLSKKKMQKLEIDWPFIV